MCGIAGIVARDPIRSGQLDQLALMSRAMAHRGPDGVGEFQAPHVALAMRRLSIIDPTTGWQPLYDEDQSIAVIANGEIYNYVELRELLAGRGHVFRTQGDIEVIPHLYQEYGDRCVDHLRGMFAFALWDARRQTLLLARDRMGEKPLYLYERPGVLYFGSELKTLLRSGVAAFELDPIAIDRYFHYQYVPEPLTPIQGVRKLPAGHTLSVAVQPWTIEEKCYWRMEDAPPLDGDPAQRIRDELDTISGLIIRSDVPVGVALSGGLDSSAIAVLAARKYPGTMHAFSVGYAGRPHSDERSDALALAQHLGMPFHDIELETGDIVRSFSDLVGWQDDPIADGAGFGYFAIAREARRQGVPVLLQGQGGDELFWGYDWVVDSVRQSLRKSTNGSTNGPHFADYLEFKWPKFFPRRAPIDWLVSLGGLRSSWSSFQRDVSGPKDRLVFYDLTQHYRNTERARHQMFSASMVQAIGEAAAHDVFRMPRPWSELDIVMTRLICQTYLLENGIAQGDRLSMASSVELRLPLVDYRLVETVIGLRKAHSDIGLPAKTWFREAVGDVVPDWVRNRPKRGFQAPTRVWHRALFEAHGHLLRDGALVQHGILQPEAARRLSRGDFSITETAPLSFRALVLEAWCRQAQAGVSHPPSGDTVLAS
jgi:asparagine synthase (glutamine-hydrolysing)